MAPLDAQAQRLSCCPSSQAVASRASIEEKSRAFIQQQHAQLEQLSQAKVRGQLAVVSVTVGLAGPAHLPQEGSEHLVQELQQQLSQLRSQVSQGEGAWPGRGQCQVPPTTQVQLAAMEENRQAGEAAEAAIKT